MPVRRQAMSAITQCPECSTCFRVSQEQLDACHGLVRCGRCETVFNATAHFRDEEPNPQLDLLAVLEHPAPSPANSTEQPGEEQEEEIPVGDKTVPMAAFPAEPQPAEEEVSLGEKTIPMAAFPDEYQTAAEEPATETGELPEPVVSVQQVAISEGVREHHFAVARRKKDKRRWPWVVGCLLLVIVMLGQATYFYRVELAAQLPGLKPALNGYCMLLRCSIPLPRKIDLISIESSDLEADPAHASAITLNASLRNNAPHAQAFPDLELTLTDTQGKVVARRTFKPVDYLTPEDNEKQGMPSHREVSIKLRLDTSDLKPTGYRLFLYYAS